MRKLTTYLIGGILMFVVLTGCSSRHNAGQELFKYKGSYIGNNSAVVNIINKFPYSKEFNGVSLQTKKKPYGMDIKYGDVTGNITKTVITNATTIFVLVKNADWITFNFPNRQYTLTRQQLQSWYGEDLSKITDENDFKKLIQTHLNDDKKVSELLTTKKPSQETPKLLSISKVKATIQNVEKGKNVSDIHIIGLKNSDGVGASFASFKLDGKLNYVNMFSSKQQGTGTGVFTVSDLKQTPIQYTAQIAENGYSSITGITDRASDIKKVIITFSNGQIREVPDVNDEFWFFGKTGATEKDAYSKEVIGVTTNGSIVVKKN
jgi:hypothetical protein